MVRAVEVLRPVQRLTGMMRTYPLAGIMVDLFWSGRGKDLPDWPEWCLLPMSGWYAIICETNGINSLPLPLAAEPARLAAVGTWRYSQGIYRVDSDVLAALTDSPISGNIPSEVLYRLPEWCVYVETPGHQWMGETLHGFWSHLEWDAKTTRTELRFLLDLEGEPLGLSLHVGPWTIIEAVDRMIAEAEKYGQKRGIDIDATPDAVQEAAKEINPLVSILLYLCSGEPEISNARMPGTSPARARPTKTKRGWRLFPAPGPRIWTTGEHLGAKLRQAVAGDPTGRMVKAHLRRGHWHGYWTGPRQGERKFLYHWIHPLIAGGAE